MLKGTHSVYTGSSEEGLPGAIPDHYSSFGRHVTSVGLDQSNTLCVYLLTVVSLEIPDRIPQICIDIFDAHHGE
jgi:hypothetical protein